MTISATVATYFRDLERLYLTTRQPTVAYYATLWQQEATALFHMEN